MLTKSQALEYIEPMMPTLVAKPPEGDRWFHEIKYDGYRTQIIISGSEARAYTRRGHDWTDKYRILVDAARELFGRDIHIDGELIVQDESGRPDFGKLRSSIMSGGDHLILYVFDLLSLDGEDLRRRRCQDRRSLLCDLFEGVEPTCPLQMSESFEGSGAEFFAAVDQMGLEGIVSKRRDSIYESGRTTDWLKTKTFAVSEFTIVGYDRTPGSAATLLVASEIGGKLRYAGRVMVTLGGKKREKLWGALAEREISKPVIAELKKKGAVWVRPELKARVRHLRGEEMLRHATMVK
ncbi:MAG TPA: non-homologous end-joining DNA ligase [Rhizobiaceae bacterium]|nr:non-homologous end-joining DNA ligase [Rhizobiaceae bacterium]